MAGIESPGLTASPATAEYVVELLREQGLLLTESQSFSPVRKGPVRFHQLTRTQQRELIAKDPAYGHIICRCETVTEGEIRDAIRAPPARAMWMASSGAPVRAWAAAGRLLRREGAGNPFARAGIPEEEVTKFGGKSNILYEKTK